MHIGVHDFPRNSAFYTDSLDVRRDASDLNLTTFYCSISYACTRCVTRRTHKVEHAADARSVRFGSVSMGIGRKLLFVSYTNAS